VFLAEAAGSKSALPRMVKVGYRELSLIYVSVWVCVGGRSSGASLEGLRRRGWLPA
jgi:hypothetical protein